MSSPEKLGHAQKLTTGSTTNDDRRFKAELHPGFLLHLGRMVALLQNNLEKVDPCFHDQLKSSMMGVRKKLQQYCFNRKIFLGGDSIW